MKKNQLIAYSWLIFTIAASVIVYSCQKEKMHGTSENQSIQTAQDDELEKKIKSFREKIDLIRENPALKSGTEPMEVDSALWYIEATSNLTYGDASFESEEFIVDSAFIEVPVTNDQILWSDIQVAYDQVIDSLSEHNANISTNDKQLIVADISLKETTDNLATFEVTSGIGTGETGLGSGNVYPWYWGWELGRCDGSGLGQGYDAADKIAQLANYTVAVPNQPSYYTDVEYKSFDPSDYPGLLFEDFQEYTLNHQCLSTADIATYKSNLIYIGGQEMPSGKSLIRYYLYDMTAFPLCGPDQHDCWVMEHHGEIKYAIWHTSSDPPAEL